MGSGYNIMGRVIPPHQMAIGTISLVALICMPNPFAVKTPRTVDLKTGNKEEEKFIEEYLAENASKH